MLYIYDLAGKEVYSEYALPFTSIKHIDLRGKLEHGLYALRMVWEIAGGARNYVKGKVIIQKD